MLPRADFPRRWRKRGNTEVGEKKPIGEEKIVTVAGLLLIRGLRIQSQPRCYKWTRRPEPICCLSSSNGDQFQAEKNQVEPERKRKCQWRSPARDELPAAGGGGRGEGAKEVGKGGCAGWVGTCVLIGQSLSGRVLQSRPRSSTSSSFPSAPFPPPSPPPPSPPQAPAGGKMEASVSSYRPQPPGHLHPIGSRFFLPTSRP